MSRFVLIAAIMLSFVLTACSEGTASPTPTLIPGMPSATAPVTATVAPPTSGPPPPGPPPTPLPGVQVPSVVLLIDARTGSRVTLYESYQDPAYSSEFDETEVTVTYRGVGALKAGHYDLQGVLLRTTDLPGPSFDAACTQAGDGAVVRGRVYADVLCGPISPDGRWMTYEVPLMPRPPGGSGVPWDQWVVDLQTSDHWLLQAGLQHCGGCDSRFGPAWSPSGRYLYFAELVGDGRTFLSDLEARTTREIYRGHTDSGYEPDWSPTSDLLIYPNGRGTTTLDNLEAFTVTELAEIAWPARFDSSGSYVYAPAWSGSQVPASQTAILDVHSGRVEVLAGGVGRPSRYTPVEAVISAGTTRLAALESAPGCAGTAVYSDRTLQHCVKGAVAPAFSPDGSTLALLRKTGDIGRFASPSGSALFGSVYEAILVDLQTGRERIVASDVIGPTDVYLYPARWNEAGSHLLLQYPFVYGL